MVDLLMCREGFPRTREGILPPWKLLWRLAKGDGELRSAGFRRIVEGVTSAISLGGLEEQSASDAGGKTGEAGFAVDVGSDLEIEFVETSVSHANLDLGGVNRLAVRVVDGEVGRAGTQSPVYDRNRMRVRLLSSQWERQGQKYESAEAHTLLCMISGWVAGRRTGADGCSAGLPQRNPSTKYNWVRALKQE